MYFILYVITPILFVVIIMTLFGAQKNKADLGRLFYFMAFGKGFAKTSGKGVSNSMSVFLMGWWKQSL